MNTRKIGIIAKTELVLSLRSLDLILFGFLMPLAIIIVIGLIYGDRGTGQGMIERNIGSWISIGICAVGLMGLPLTLADYREKKVLKRLQVNPKLACRIAMLPAYLHRLLMKFPRPVHGGNEKNILR